MMAVPHIGFILAAYGLTGLAMIGMVAKVVTDGRALRRALDRLDARRGSSATSAGTRATRIGSR